MSDSSNFQQLPYDVRLSWRTELSYLKSRSVWIFSSKATLMLNETIKERIMWIRTTSIIGNWFIACSMLGGSDYDAVISKLINSANSFLNWKSL